MYKQNDQQMFDKQILDILEAHHFHQDNPEKNHISISMVYISVHHCKGTYLLKFDKDTLMNYRKYQFSNRDILHSNFQTLLPEQFSFFVSNWSTLGISSLPITMLMTIKRNRKAANGVIANFHLTNLIFSSVKSP